ncbi:MAG: sigma-70 family RNA polymerase sigma factor [Ruminococcus sp.]|nr:sigma-70 family RNA polymerase sigma factor [Ruminococcus sp.]
MSNNKNNNLYNQNINETSLNFPNFDLKIRSILKSLEVFEDDDKDLFDELYQAGILGIIEAINSYHPNIETPLRVHLQNNIVYSMIRTYRSKLLFSSYSIDRLSLARFKSLINAKNIAEIPPNFSFYNEADYYCRDTEDKALRNIDLEKLHELIPLLSPIEQQVLNFIYGLHDTPLKSYRKIASILNITYYNVNHIHHRALKKLRKLYHSDNIPPIKR